MNRILTATLTALVLSACAPQDEYIPRLGDLSAEADAAMSLVDRDAALQDAQDYDRAPAGEALELATVPDGYRMEIASETIVPEARRTLANVFAGGGLVLAGDLAAAVAIGPPAIGIAVAVDGEITELAPNVWYAENSIPWFGQQVTAHLTVAWVGVGWLSEMRLSTDDGDLDHELWFNGFVSNNGAIGWWDFYDKGTLVGVLEWVSNGTDSQIGGALTAGDVAGDLLSWSWLANGDASFVFYDADRAETSWVTGHADSSGEVRTPDHNGGDVGCWATDLQDVSCP